MELRNDSKESKNNINKMTIELRDSFIQTNNRRKILKRVFFFIKIE